MLPGGRSRRARGNRGLLPGGERLHPPHGGVHVHHQPDEHFILDRHPAVDDAFIAAGFSGHGCKFCSVIGRIMADFCLGEEGKWGVEGFGLGEGRW